MKRTMVCVLAITGGLLASAVSATAQDKAKAEAIISSQKCSMCHAIGGKGNPKGSLDGVGTKLKPEEIRQWLLDPDAMRAKAKATRTPAMKPLKLSKDQVDVLVAYLQTLK